MFDFVNRKKRIVQVIMGLAVLPFLFWGVESYRDKGSDGYVAIVDGEEIPRREYEQALRDHHDRMRAMLGSNFDSAMLDSFEVRNSVLEHLIQQRLLYREAAAHGFTVLDSQLVKTLREVPAFQKENKFSKQQYEELLRAQGLTPATFESRVRQELLLQQLLDGYSESGFSSTEIAKKVRYLSEVQREINQIRIEPESFLADASPEEADINTYYEKNKTDFDLPERIQIEYLILSLDDVAKTETVSDESIDRYFSEHQTEFDQPEERQASHILISVTANTSDEDKQAARQKAETLLQQIRQNPDQFSEIAEKQSDDPGSAKRGGDLGFFGRGVMVKAFEEKVFSMQSNEISDLIETDFGFHIIKLTGIKEEKSANLSDVREQIEKKLRMEQAGSIFGEIAEDFSNTVYEQGESLQPAADKFGLAISKTDWITKDSVEPDILNHTKLLSAVFSNDAITNRRNSEAIEVRPDTLVSARIAGHKPATAQSLTMVRDQIVEKLRKELAEKRAIEEGQSMLVRLLNGEDVEIAWNDAQQISYMQSQGLDRDTLQAIFRAEADKLPVYTGTINPKGGFNLIRITRIIEPESVKAEKLGEFTKQLQQMITQEETSAYLNAVRQRYDVRIRQSNF